MKSNYLMLVTLMLCCCLFLSSCGIVEIFHESHLIKRNSENIYKMAEKSVGEIVIYNKFDEAVGLGTCFVYSSDGRLITNYHVVEDAYSAIVTIAGESYVVEQIFAYDPDKDIALIKIDATNLSPLSLWYGHVGGGEKVYAVGSSKGLTMSFTSRVVASANRTIDGVHYVQHDAAISNGNSGGPLMNEYGEVIGINTWYIKEGQNINFAISTSELDNLKYTQSIVLKKTNVSIRRIAFETIKNHAIRHGLHRQEEYYLSENFTIEIEDYFLEVCRFEADTYPGTNIFRVIYNVKDNVLSFNLYNGNYVVGIQFINPGSTYQEVIYSDKNVSESGIASIYVDEYISGYKPRLTPQTPQINQMNKDLLDKMLDCLVEQIDTQFRDIGVSAYDLGFESYKR